MHPTTATIRPVISTPPYPNLFLVHSALTQALCAFQLNTVARDTTERTGTTDIAIDEGYEH
jgi:hypothetical protein